MDFSLGKSGNELVIDCSSSDLKLVVGNYNSKTGNISIEKMGIVPLEGDAINDGAVSDSFGIVMALKHAIARLDIRMKSCIITTEGAFVHTRDLELPVVKEDQLKDMVKYESTFSCDDAALHSDIESCNSMLKCHYDTERV